MSRYLVDLEKIPWASPQTGLRTKTFEQENRQIRLVEYSPEMEPHWCERGHIGMIINGELEVKWEAETTVFKAGDGVFIPSGPEHRHMAQAIHGVVRAIFVEDAASDSGQE